MSTLPDLIREAAVPLVGAPGDYDALLELVGDARFVLLGEASHGTHEFYRERGVRGMLRIMSATSRKGANRVKNDVRFLAGNAMSRRLEESIPGGENAAPYSISTVIPLVMSFERRTTSQFPTRMQPWLVARPMVQALEVPWMPMPGLFRPIQRTPTGLRGPGGSM